MSWQPDQMDMMCMAWAKQRRIMLKLIPNYEMTQREQMGRPNCTLGQVREEGEGASQGSTINQNFPEVFLGDALIVHRARQTMRGQWREVMHAHYVERDKPTKVRCKELGITDDQYFKCVREFKMYLEGFAANVTVQTA